MPKGQMIVPDVVRTASKLEFSPIPINLPWSLNLTGRYTVDIVRDDVFATLRVSKV